MDFHCLNFSSLANSLPIKWPQNGIMLMEGEAIDLKDQGPLMGIVKVRESLEFWELKLHRKQLTTASALIYD